MAREQRRLAAILSAMGRNGNGTPVRLRATASTSGSSSGEGVPQCGHGKPNRFAVSPWTVSGLPVTTQRRSSTKARHQPVNAALGESGLLGDEIVHFSCVRLDAPAARHRATSSGVGGHGNSSGQAEKGEGGAYQKVHRGSPLCGGRVPSVEADLLRTQAPHAVAATCERGCDPMRQRQSCDVRKRDSMAAVADFAHKFGLVLKACNFSRGRLAQIVGVDKSVVSRWASGVQVPTDHNLTVLTEAVMRHRPGFARSDWDLDPEVFAGRLFEARNQVEHPLPAPLPERPAPDKVHSILVMPFTSAGGQDEQQTLAEAITDDLTHDLSRIPGTLVIAQGTATTFKGKSVDARAAAREFAVRYVVDGSVRIGPARVRINVQLVDAETGGQVWSDRIEAPRAELADLQENISGRIAWALELELPGVESRRGQRNSGTSSDAFELGMLGWSLMNRPPSRENIIAAEGHFRRACELDPGSLPARIGLSFTYVRRVSSHWSETPEEDLSRATALIDPALSEAPRHDRGHFVKGLILRTEVQPEQSSVFLERAIQLNPNYAQAIAFLGFNRALVGHPEQTFDLIERAIRLSPHDPQLGVWLTFASIAHIQLGQYDRAVTAASRSVALNPEYGNNHLVLAQANALAGRREEAIAALASTMHLLPHLSARALRKRRMSRHPAVVEAGGRSLAALKGIGLPD